MTLVFSINILWLNRSTSRYNAKSVKLNANGTFSCIHCLLSKFFKIKQAWSLFDFKELEHKHFKIFFYIFLFLERDFITRGWQSFLYLTSQNSQSAYVCTLHRPSDICQSKILSEVEAGASCTKLHILYMYTMFELSQMCSHTMHRLKLYIITCSILCSLKVSHCYNEHDISGLDTIKLAAQ